ncbi:Putative peptidoglycan binding domain-containing protein [Shimia gijangensis]|uniref:Putative peptidoglycan binding domain-containing protein n=1 Tax=Shimia gijangensis TaxID=1470563 RepID=A0A1M6D3T5_9RHOB|nr:serine protease [Shimia gijangensis]SHI67942.1 Putative peptidoglycan binding domain-containing protein [Shimia gijangensis]
MIRVLLSLCFTILISTQSALAQSDQDIAWVQVEAQPSLTVTQQRAQVYSRDLQDVNGFSLGGGWYAVALGPYTLADAETVLNVYRNEGLIPVDSFVAESSVFQKQFWPVGANLLNLPAQVQPQLGTGETTASTTPEPEPEPIDETPREARASEAELTKDERKDLQSWLKWAGYYNSAIDGAFGRGTRGSMGAWQADNGYEATGVLTTMQRAKLRAQYFAVLEGMDLRLVSDPEAGIDMQLPMGILSQPVTEFPFVQFDASGDVPAKVLLISQAGDQNTLFGLYDIMQTLEIVPLEGERSRKDKSFVLTGQNLTIVSHTEVSLKDGHIKGFTLVWPIGDEERRSRILGEMQASFTRTEGVLDPAAGSNSTQSIDLLSGLEIRKPKMSRSGFFVDNNGTVITTVEAVQSCTRVTLENDYQAEILVIDDASGIAILRPTTKLSPMRVASLRSGDARLQSDVAVSGYSYEGVLGAPTMTFGVLSDIKGLRGEPELKRLAMNALPGDTGGPVLDSEGTVMGMLLPKANQNGQNLPNDVSFALGSDAIASLLSENGLVAQVALGEGTQAPEDISRLGSDMTVLVSCWN